MGLLFTAGLLITAQGYGHSIGRQWKKKKRLHSMENQKIKFDFVFLGQSVIKYQVPLDIFVAINQIYEKNYSHLWHNSRARVVPG